MLTQFQIDLIAVAADFIVTVLAALVVLLQYRDEQRWRQQKKTTEEMLEALDDIG